MSAYGVIGNCQARGIARCVSRLDPASAVHLVMVQRLRLASDEQKQEWLERLSTCDVVLAQRPEADILGPFSRENLEARGMAVIQYPSVIFTGLFPDFTIVRYAGGRLAGPLGEFHSALIAAAFLNELPEARAVRLFNAYTYALLGYFEKYELSRSYLSEECALLGYDLSILFDSSTKPMHSCYHPTMATLLLVARQALAKAGVSTPPCPPPGNFPHEIDWPIYPEIANRAGLANLGGLEFEISDEGQKRRLSLKEFVSRSYAVFRHVEGGFSAKPIEHARQVLRESVIPCPDHTFLCGRLPSRAIATQAA